MSKHSLSGGGGADDNIARLTPSSAYEMQYMETQTTAANPIIASTSDPSSLSNISTKEETITSYVNIIPIKREEAIQKAREALLEKEANSNNHSSHNHNHGHGTTATQTGKFGAITNYLNTILGAGIIGIPFAIQQCGSIVGISLLVFVAVLTNKSLRLIVECAKHHPILKNKSVSTFEDLMSYTFGSHGSLFILWCMFIIAYGSMVAYLLVIKDTIWIIVYHMFNENHTDGPYDDRNLFLVLSSLCIMLPLSMLKDLASLAFTSFLSIFAAIVTVLLTIFVSPIGDNIANEGGIAQLLKNDAVLKPSIFIGLSILSDAFACHHAAYIVYGSLRKPSRRRWGIVTSYSLTLAASIFILFGLAGYLGYGEQTEANLLNNFSKDNLLANIARILLTTTFFFTYPMEAMVARHVLLAIMNEQGDLEEEFGPFSFFKWRHFMTFAVYFMTLIPALVFDDLGPVLALTGAIGGSCLAYITPGALYLGVYGQEFLALCAEFLSSFKESSFQDDDGVIKVENINVPIAGEGKLEMVKLNRTSKPFWWYLLGFPIWTRIASLGRDGLNKKVAQLTYEEVERKSFHPIQPVCKNRTKHHHNPEGIEKDPQCGVLAPMECLIDVDFADLISPDDTIEDEVVRPTKWDFAVAIFYILFGIIAMCLGVMETITDIVEEDLEQ